MGVSPDKTDKISPPEDSRASGSWIFDKPNVVEIDLLKDSAINTLVITGANAGGKTVAMKTLGLFVLMHQSGIHLSRLVIFARNS